MTKLKTKKNEANVEKFLSSVDNEQRRKDGFELLKIMKEVTGEEPKMWGSSIIGFGDYHYKYESGREGDFFQVGFSPRKNAMSLYLMASYKKFPVLMEKLGKHKTGKSCIYINKLEDINLGVLQELIKQSIDYLEKKDSK